MFRKHLDDAAAVPAAGTADRAHQDLIKADRMRDTVTGIAAR